jgi:hypothetical protein
MLKKILVSVLFFVSGATFALEPKEGMSATYKFEMDCSPRNNAAPKDWANKKYTRVVTNVRTEDGITKWDVEKRDADGDLLSTEQNKNWILEVGTESELRKRCKSYKIEAGVGKLQIVRFKTAIGTLLACKTEFTETGANSPSFIAWSTYGLPTGNSLKKIDYTNFCYGTGPNITTIIDFKK